MKFIIEQSAYSGVLKIAGKVAHDMELVTGTLPEIRVVETIDHEQVAGCTEKYPDGCVKRKTGVLRMVFPG